IATTPSFAHFTEALVIRSVLSVGGSHAWSLARVAGTIDSCGGVQRSSKSVVARALHVATTVNGSMKPGAEALRLSVECRTVSTADAARTARSPGWSVSRR